MSSSGQFGCQDYDKVIETSIPVSTKSSMSRSFIPILNFAFSSLIEVYQNTCFLVSTKFFVLSYIAALLSIAV